MFVIMMKERHKEYEVYFRTMKVGTFKADTKFSAYFMNELVYDSGEVGKNSVDWQVDTFNFYSKIGMNAIKSAMIGASSRIITESEVFFQVKQ